MVVNLWTVVEVAPHRLTHCWVPEDGLQLGDGELLRLWQIRPACKAEDVGITHDGRATYLAQGWAFCISTEAALDGEYSGRSLRRVTRSQTRWLWDPGTQTGGFACRID